MADAPRPGDMSPLEQAQAYVAGRSYDIARDVVAAPLVSHLAMQQAGDEMPSVAEVFQAGAGLANMTSLAAVAILDLFRPHFARLTQELKASRDLGRFYLDDAIAQRQRAELAEQQIGTSLAFVEESRLARGEAASEIAALRARVAELEDAARADALTHHDGATKDRNRIDALEITLSRVALILRNGAAKHVDRVGDALAAIERLRAKERQP
jgi:hypothetical protein